MDQEQVTVPTDEIVEPPTPETTQPVTIPIPIPDEPSVLVDVPIPVEPPVVVAEPAPNPVTPGPVIVEPEPPVPAPEPTSAPSTKPEKPIEIPPASDPTKQPDPPKSPIPNPQSTPLQSNLPPHSPAPNPSSVSPQSPIPTLQSTSISTPPTSTFDPSTLSDSDLKAAAALYAKKNQKSLSRLGVEKRQETAKQNISSVTDFIKTHSPASNATISRALNLPPRRVQHYMQILTHNGTVTATGWGASRRYFKK